jgi:hypothetical protein
VPVPFDVPKWMHYLQSGARSCSMDDEAPVKLTVVR